MSVFIYMNINFFKFIMCLCYANAYQCIHHEVFNIVMSLRIYIQVIPIAKWFYRNNISKNSESLHGFLINNYICIIKVQIMKQMCES